MATSVAEPSQVRCKGRGLAFGRIGKPIESMIDTRRAGPGELTIYCNNDDDGRPAQCEVIDHQDGQFTLTVRTNDIGNFSLNILYDNIHVPGSPFALRVSAASMVKVTGAGIQDGVINNRERLFYVDTSGAGKGEVEVEIGGPRGAFKIETKQEKKSLICSYNVREPGQYIINVFWCRDHAADSPYHVFIARTAEELERYQLVRNTQMSPGTVQTRGRSRARSDGGIV